MQAQLPPRALGIEVGAHSLPVPGIAPYYVDRVVTYAGVDSRIDIQADAVALPFPTGELDYLCSSHVLEHLVNPIAGLLEWHRVLRPGGLLYLVVPDKRFTFDEPRTVTPPGHVVADFENMMEVTEREHVREFIYDTDWTRLQPGVKPDDIGGRQEVLFQGYITEIESTQTVDIHHHTFTPDSLHELLRQSGLIGGSNPSFELEARAEKYPAQRADGIGCLLRKLPGDEEEQEGETFTFSDPPSLKSPVRLVCPATLARLKLTATNQEGDRLEAVGHKHGFAFHGQIPVLLPPPNVPLQRTWCDYGWRKAKLAKGSEALA